MASATDPIESILAAAVELGSEADRRVYVERACAGDAELKRRVDELIDNYLQAGDFLESPAPDLGATNDRLVGERPGTAIGSYKLLEQIGEGGFGTVFMAEQTEPVRRKVALKVLKAGMDTRQVVARFEAERQALALMDHPYIAKVFDGGETPAGRPYFVMELVRGVPITDYCDLNQLPPRDRLELFVQVCQAVQHAHQKGIIHRDIKPSNVLVTAHDGRPGVKVIDFGVAKAAGAALTDKTLFTGFAQLVGTPLYMSPEQAGQSPDIDTRSDIYSLGVLLYELLTGSTPITKERLREAAYDEIRRIIREEDPPRPSTRLSASKDTLPSISALRHTEPAKLTKLVRGELDWIVMTALEKDRNRRYETANSFAADVQRYLADEPVQACPPSAGYRLSKFARRNRAAVLTAAAILFVLVAGIAGTTFGLIRAELRRAEADRARADEATQRKTAEAEKKKAEQAEADTLADYRASTDDAIEQLIGSKPDLGPQERAYLEKTLKRWQAFAARQGDDERGRAIRAEGHHRVAALWSNLGQRDKARTEYETARDLHQKLAADFPAVPGHQQGLASDSHNLGNVLMALGRYDAARTVFETARDLRQKLATAFPAVPDYQLKLALAHHNLGILLGAQGQRDAARTEYETARDLLKKLTATFPAVPEYQHHLSTTHNSLGNVLGNLGQRDAALTEYGTARDLQRKLANAFPAVPEYQKSLASTHNNMGTVLLRMGQYDAARSEFQTALDLRQKLAAAFPAVPLYQQHLNAAHNNLGTVLLRMGRYDAARSELQTARDLRKKLADAFPAVPEYQIELGGTYFIFGYLVRDQGQPADSLQWFDLAIRTLTPVYEKDRRVVTAKESFRNSYAGRAGVYDRLKKHTEAVKDWDKAIELGPAPEQPTYRASRAMSRLRAGQTAEAVAEVAELTKASNWVARQWYDFACVYAVASSRIADQKQAYADRAMELLLQAVKAGFKDAAHMAEDPELDPLRQREDFQKLLAKLQAGKK